MFQNVPILNVPKVPREGGVTSNWAYVSNFMLFLEGIPKVKSGILILSLYFEAFPYQTFEEFADDLN